MADPIQVANSAAQLTGKTLMTLEAVEAVTGQKTFSLAPNPPFAVESGSGTVDNLDADLLDGEEGSFYRNASNLNAGTIPGARFPSALPAVSAENLVNIPAANLTGEIPDTAVPDPLPAVSGANLSALPNPLPAVSGANLTSLNASELGSGSVPYARVPTPLKSIERGGAVVNPNGITAAVNVIVWRAPYACTVKKVWGYRVGGSGATINARRNGSDNHLSSALSLTSGDAWTDGGTVQNTSYTAGDKMEIMVVSVTGSPTQVAVLVELEITGS